jgi:hypothetical protein
MVICLRLWGVMKEQILIQPLAAKFGRPVNAQ